MRSMIFAALALLLSNAVWAQDSKSPATSAVSTDVSPSSALGDKFAPSAIEQQLLDLANLERKKADAAPLVCSPLLIDAARRHSANMARQGRLDHTLDGKCLGVRLDEVGCAWGYCAENIAMGQRSPAEAIQSWMHSPGHRANLLSSNCTQIGVAVASGAGGQPYWTMVLSHSR